MFSISVNEKGIIVLTGRLDAAQVERADRLELDAVADEARGARADEDLAPLRRLLETRSEVDGLAGGERRLAVVGDHLARLDPADRPDRIAAASPGAKPPKHRVELWHSLAAVMIGLLFLESALTLRRRRV